MQCGGGDRGSGGKRETTTADMAKTERNPAEWECKNAGQKIAPIAVD